MKFYNGLACTVENWRSVLAIPHFVKFNKFYTMQTQKYLRKHCRVSLVCNTPLIGTLTNVWYF